MQEFPFTGKAKKTIKVKERLFSNCPSATAKAPVNTLNIFETFVEGRSYDYLRTPHNLAVT